jgi:hypothetical protein
MDPVVHFEIPATDKQKLAKFYNQAFGWKSQMLGPEMNDYVLITTAESDEKGHPKRPGAINGGMFKKSADKPAQYPSVVIAVGDIKQTMKLVREAGGEVLGEPMEIPGYGLYVSFFDPERNRVAVMQPITM